MDTIRYKLLSEAVRARLNARGDVDSAPAPVSGRDEMTKPSKKTKKTVKKNPSAFSGSAESSTPSPSNKTKKGHA